MFTGLIEAVGTVNRLVRAGETTQLHVDAGRLAENLKIGDSVAVDGACLTAVNVQRTVATFDVSAETLDRTTLGSFVPGRTVNLERALRVGDRLGGHFVLGHVDGLGTLLAKRPSPGQVAVEIGVSPDIVSQLIPKGSIAVDGISLTIADLGADRFAVAVIPHTLEHTALKHRSVGEKMNLELDVIGKYVLRLLRGMKDTDAGPQGGGLTQGFLREHGF